MTAAQAHTFDWTLAIARNRDALLRIVAVLFVYAGLDEGGAGELPRHAWRAIVAVLRMNPPWGRVVTQDSGEAVRWTGLPDARALDGPRPPAWAGDHRGSCIDPGSARCPDLPLNASTGHSSCLGNMRHHA